MSSSAAAIVFEEIFTVKRVDPDGKKFEKVSRLQCVAETFSDVELVVDIHSELYPMREGRSFSMALATTLSLDGKPADAEYDQSGQPSLLDKYEYAMYGKVFKFEHTKGTNVAIYASFGGLLMSLKGAQEYFMNLQVDQDLYCLMKGTE